MSAPFLLDGLLAGCQARLSYGILIIRARLSASSWRALPDACCRRRGQYDGRYATAAFRPLRGPIPLSLFAEHASP